MERFIAWAVVLSPILLLIFMIVRVSVDERAKRGNGKG